MSPMRLLDAVRKEVQGARSRGVRCVTAEELARKLHVRKGKITAALQQLGREGLVGHKYRTSMIVGKGRSFWEPSVFVLVGAPP